VETGGAIHLQESIQTRDTFAPAKKRIAIWIVCLAVAAIAIGFAQFYFLRELAAALLIFTILFLMIAAIVGVVYLIGSAGQKGYSIAEPAARRGLVLAEEISRKTFHRPRSVPVR
jgi:hypothetical protein